MVTVNIKVGEKSQSIDLGTRLENEARVIVFDVSYLVERYGEGSAQLLVKRPQDESPYPIAITQEGSEVVWVVSNTDLQYKGQGEAELFWYVGEEGLAKSIVYSTWVAKDIGEEGEPPEAWEGYIEQIQGYAQTASDSAEEAQGVLTEVQEIAENLVPKMAIGLFGGSTTIGNNGTDVTITHKHKANILAPLYTNTLKFSKGELNFDDVLIISKNNARVQGDYALTDSNDNNRLAFTHYTNNWEIAADSDNTIWVSKLCVDDPTSAKQATNKEYVDNAIQAALKSFVYKDENGDFQVKE